MTTYKIDSLHGSTRPVYQPPEPPRLHAADTIDKIFRQAEQAETARQRQQETESKPVKQLTRADLKTMKPAQIEQARKDGQLADLLRGGPPQAVMSPAELRIKQLEYDGITQATEADLKTMTRSQIVEAQHEGRLTAILAGIKPAASET